MYKICLIITIFFLGTCFAIKKFEIPENLRPYAEKLHKKCQEQTGADEDLIKKSHNGFLSDDRKVKCYIHCLFDKVGLIDENNVMHLEHIMEIIPTETHEIVERVTAKCGTQHGADGCETAYLTVKCYFEADPENAMLI